MASAGVEAPYTPSVAGEPWGAGFWLKRVCQYRTMSGEAVSGLDATLAAEFEAPNLAAAVRLHATRTPDKVALVEVGQGRREVTWAELDRLVEESAEAYDALGVLAGQRVVLLGHNTIDLVTAYLGALRGGLVVVPANPALTPSELQHVVDHCGAPLLLADTTEFEIDGVRVETLASLRDHAKGSRVESVPDAEAIALIIYTAGTSGEPKGVMLSHRALLAHCAQSVQSGAAGEDSVAIALLPLFHVYGLNAVLGTAVYIGATTVLVDGMPDDLGDLIFRERISHLPVTPSVLYRLTQDEELTAASGSLRLVTSGAAPLPAVLGETFTRLTGLRVEQGYGLSEAGPGVSTTLGTEHLGSGYVGRPLPGVEVRIGDADTAAVESPGEPGEIWLRGPNLFSGYWPDGHDGPDDDGWFPSGDVGQLQGQDLFLVDRVREMILVSGFNVYPSEVEEVLAQHPAVESAAVVGQPDEHSGERVVAFLTGEKINVAQVRQWAQARLARYKLPSEIVVLKAMPRSATGKVRKGLLRDILDRTDES